ncbi:hypothetical protein [Spiroplasma endosymbiont of Glossina fuscipes fuscipes]
MVQVIVTYPKIQIIKLKVVIKTIIIEIIVLIGDTIMISKK